MPLRYIKGRQGVKARGSYKRRPYVRKRMPTPWRKGPTGGHSWAGFGTNQALIKQPTSTDRLFVKLRKTFVGEIKTGAAGVFSTSGIVPNDLTDPLNTFGSGSPDGFSTYCGSASMYREYIVHAFKLTWNFTNSAGNPLIMCFVPRAGGAAAPTSMEQAQSNPRARWCILQGSQQGNNFMGSMKYTVASLYGQSDQTVASADSFSALYNAAPTSYVAVDICMQDVHGTTQLTAAGTFVLEFYVEFLARNLL